MYKFWSFSIQLQRLGKNESQAELRQKLLQRNDLEDFLDNYLNCDIIFCGSEEGDLHGRPHWQCSIGLQTAEEKKSFLAKWKTFYKAKLASSFYSQNALSGLEPTYNHTASMRYALNLDNDKTSIDQMGEPGKPYDLRNIKRHWLKLSEFNLGNFQNNMFSWQQSIFAMMEQHDPESEDRIINLIIDPEGSSGKSSFVRFCRLQQLRAELSHDFMKAVPSTFSTAASLAQSICISCDGQRYKNFLIDVPRTAASFNQQSGFSSRYGEIETLQILSVLESLRNGFLQSSFAGRNHELLIPPPAIYVFANSLPETVEFPSNRYKIFHLLRKNSDIVLQPGKPTQLARDNDYWAQYTGLNDKEFY